MNYETCLKACIAAFQADGDTNAEAAIATYSGYPVPTAVEWADVLARTSTYGDTQDPFDCMGQYECRLHDRGFKTVLDAEVDKYKAIAVRVGLPLEYLEDALAIFVLMESEVSKRH